jgi:hypothetical protein
MNKEQIAAAVQAGLELLGPESNTPIPARLNDGIFILKQLLVGIAQGQIALAPGQASEQPVEPPAAVQKPQPVPTKKAAKKKTRRAK